MARTIGRSSLFFGVLALIGLALVYPTPADEATERELNPNTWLTLTGVVNGEDGSSWYRTDSGDFVPSDAVFVPARTEDFTGRWLDVNLNSPARVRAERKLTARKGALGC